MLKQEAIENIKNYEAEEKRKASLEEWGKIKEYGEKINEETRNKK